MLTWIWPGASIYQGHLAVGRGALPRLDHCRMLQAAMACGILSVAVEVIEVV